MLWVKSLAEVLAAVKLAYSNTLAAYEYASLVVELLSRGLVPSTKTFPL